MSNSYADIALRRFKGLLHYWFVQYNPLYFFSALSVLTGVYLVTVGLNDLGWHNERLILSAVIQAYELLLVAGTALLFRRAGQQRAAVILALMEVVFLFDCTFELEVISTVERGGWLMLAAWVALAALKLQLLVKALKLKPDKEALIIPVLGIAGLICSAKLLTITYIDKQTVHLLATWLLAILVAIYLWRRPAIACTQELDDWGQTVLRRALKSSWIVWAGFYLLHLLSWAALYDLPITLAHLTPFLLLTPLISTKEQTVWIGLLLALGSSVLHPHQLGFTASLVSTAFIVAGWQTGRYRLWNGAVLSFYVACWMVTAQPWYIPPPPLLLSVVTAITLFIIAWRVKVYSAWALGLVMLVLPAERYGKTLGVLGWGIVLLTAGFISLIVGIGVNWLLPQRPRE